MILFKNATLFDGKTFYEGTLDLLVREGIIETFGQNVSAPGAEILDLGGKVLSPGFVDLHCHMRDPGFEWREDIESAAAAAAAGGFSTAVAMPNTDPAVDNDALVRYVIEKGIRAGYSRILPAGAVTKRREGKELAEMGKMASAGCVLFTDDGAPVGSSRLFRTALQYSQSLKVRIMEHPEDTSLSRGGQVNEGRCSSLAGLKGIPASAEEIGVFRAISLSRETGVPVHLTHLSTRESVSLVREAKKEGLAVTCDVTPHHLRFSEESVIESGFDSRFKVNPPLRSSDDIESLWEALADGTVDAIATDHAPWHLDEKDLPFPEAPFGIASIECAFPGVFTCWLNRGKPFGLDRLLALFTSGPASLLPGEWPSHGRLTRLGKADLVVLDMDLERKVAVEEWKSKARLSPWEGLSLFGWPVLTMVEGRVVFDRSRE
ncbi:MAG: dihydroorotase [Synergistaceae bacterium]|jgi:dihydroorotase|nr:dihydroorotase [Synergistaceae bacterium]